MQDCLFQDGETTAVGRGEAEGVLDSWKEIASFFRREVRTVQLWEKHEGLPVRRQHHKKLGSVYAYRAELERWWTARSAMSSGHGQASVRMQQSGNSMSVAMHGAAPVNATAQVPHLLTLPFEVVHVNPDRTASRQTSAAFAEGLREDIVVELSRLRMYPTSVPVKAMPSPGTSTRSFLRTLAEEFRADMLLAGTMRANGAQLRVSVQLIRAADLRCLWSDRFDVALNDPLEAQTTLASRICQALSEHIGQLGPAISRKLSVKQHVARHASMMGSHFWNERSRTGLQKALGYFQDAVDLDPQWPDAYAGLADAYVSLSYNHLMAPRMAAVRAAEAVRTGLKLDPTSVAVRNAHINVLTNCTWDWGAAEQECVHLVDSGLMNCRTIQLYSSLMNSQGRHDEAIGLALQAQRLEPLSVACVTQASMAYFYAGDYENAIVPIRRTLELAPHFTMGHALLGRIEVERGNWDGALSAFKHAAEISNHSPFTKALLAYAHAGSGDVDAANALIDDLKREPNETCFPAYDVSAVHSMLDQEEEALANMYRARDTRDMKTIFLRQDPRFWRLRSSPAFCEIASSMSCS